MVCVVAIIVGDLRPNSMSLDFGIFFIENSKTTQKKTFKVALVEES